MYSFVHIGLPYLDGADVGIGVIINVAADAVTDVDDNANENGPMEEVVIEGMGAQREDPRLAPKQLAWC